MPNQEYIGPIVKFEKNGDTAPDKLWISEEEEVINFWTDKKTGKKITDGVDVQALVDSQTELKIRINEAKPYQGIKQWYGNSLEILDRQKELPKQRTETRPQRTETTQNQPARTKDQDIPWQVAIKGAIVILRISQTKAEDFSGLDDWTYEFLGKAANKIYTLIEDGPRPVYEEEHEPDPVEDLGDDDDSQAVMEV